MSNENAEFNEIRCNKLVLGNEETGIIELGVRKSGESTALVVSQRGAKGSIYIDFDNGRPALYLSNGESEESDGMIALSFNDEGFPKLILAGKMVEGEIENSIFLGLAQDASPRLYLSDDRKGKESYIVLGSSGNDKLYLTLANQGPEGGIIFLNAAAAFASIGMSSNSQLDDEDRGTDERWGVLIANRSDGSELNVEGESFVRVPRKKEKVDTEV